MSIKKTMGVFVGTFLTFGAAIFGGASYLKPADKPKVVTQAAKPVQTSVVEQAKDKAAVAVKKKRAKAKAVVKKVRKATWCKASCKDKPAPK